MRITEVAALPHEGNDTDEEMTAGVADTPEERWQQVKDGLIEADADAIIGDKHVEAANRTDTYELEELGGPLLQLVRRAATGPEPVYHVNDEYRSLLFMNKCYGHDLTIPVALGPPEDLPLFSVYLAPPASAEDLRKRFRTDRLVYMPTFGGTVTGINGSDVLRPCIMDTDTRDLLKADVGWRTLWYTNKGADDPLPSGIVAIEGWAFALSKDGSHDADDETAARIFYSLIRTAMEHRSV